MPRDIDYSKLPLKEQCTHKSWGARVCGYEKTIELFSKIEDEKSLEWKKYEGLIQKFVSDGNVIAQEKGLEACLVFIKNASLAKRTVTEVMPILVSSKCFGSPKAKIKDLAIQISLMYIEIEKQDVVFEELLKGTENNNPKVSAASVSAISQALREFGGNVIKMKPLLKRLPALLENRDENVRKESKILCVEMFKWIGPTIKSQLFTLKPVQLQELDGEFEKVKNEKPKIQRYLRSQGKQFMHENSTNEDVPIKEAVKEVENIFCKLSKDFYKQLKSKKWQERKEALDALEHHLTSVSKLKNDNYTDLVNALKKIITEDTHVVLVGNAAKCMAILAKRLEEKFQPYASTCLYPLLTKFKEKKQNVVVPLREAVDAIYDSMTLEIAKEDIILAMERKNPALKAETVAFLGRCFAKCTPIILNEKLLNSFIKALTKTLKESDPIIRDTSAEAIGAAWKIVGKQTIMPLLNDVDDIRMAKIIVASGEEVALANPAPVKIVPKTPTILPLRRVRPVIPNLTICSEEPKQITKRFSKALTFIKPQSPGPRSRKKIFWIPFHKK